MAAQKYSDYSGLLTTFSSVDRYAGDNSDASFGRYRYKLFMRILIVISIFLTVLVSCNKTSDNNYRQLEFLLVSQGALVYDLKSENDSLISLLRTLTDSEFLKLELFEMLVLKM